VKYLILSLILGIVVLGSCVKKPDEREKTEPNVSVGMVSNEPNEGVTGLPEDPNEASAGLRELRKQVRSGDKSQEEKARGRLLELIKPGMSREHVERWMSAGYTEVKDTVYGKEQLVVGYYCWLPRLEGTVYEGTQIMTIRYEKTEDGYRVLAVEGPHFPD